MTAFGAEGRYYGSMGNQLHWPADRYFTEDRRDTAFPGETVRKYHETLTTCVNGLIRTGFEVTGLIEPEPDARLPHPMTGMTNEPRRPMTLLVSAKSRLATIKKCRSLLTGIF